MTVVRFRWLLALLAMLTPATFQHRCEQAPARTGGFASNAETVFRHYV